MEINILPKLLKQEIDAVVKSYQFLPEENNTSFHSEISEMVKSYPLLNGHYSPKSFNRNVFKVTEADISCQKPESLFPSTQLTWKSVLNEI